MPGLWILNQQVMKEVEDSVSRESGRSQPEALLEADHRQCQKRCCCQRFLREHRRGTSQGRKQNVVTPNHNQNRGIEDTLAIESGHPQPQSRQAYARLLSQGWTDALRKLQPEGPLWTFWDYERNRWPLDKGMRLDHFLLSPTVCERLVHGGVDRWVRGEENASDHAPSWIVLDQ
jgi:exonuclease III